MKILFHRLTCLLIVLSVFVTVLPAANAYAAGDPFRLDLTEMITNPDRRVYVEMMVDYYMRNDPAVQETLSSGYCALFLFEGCSDNMDDPELSDLSYYRVSAVCLAIRLDSTGQPYLCYFNDSCSTIPDRPLEYGAWYLATVGEVGPATIRDGTYELYSVRHGGAYEALHVRTAYDNDKIPAVYMTPEGFVNAKADAINIHTRTGNHTISKGMWSAGCILVGDGDFGQFMELMDSTYYTVYDFFNVDVRVGSITVNRYYLREELYKLYENDDAVDMLISHSRSILPSAYLKLCAEQTKFEEPRGMRTAKDAQLMSLPCSNVTDARAMAILTVPKGEELEIVGSLVNTASNLWYEVDYDGTRGYIYSGDLKELGWFRRFVRWLF